MSYLQTTNTIIKNKAGLLNLAQRAEVRHPFADAYFHFRKRMEYLCSDSNSALAGRRCNK